MCPRGCPQGQVLQNVSSRPRTFSRTPLLHSTVFQAEVLPFSEVAKDLLLEKMQNQRIVVLVDSQAAIKALIKCTVTSITVLNCIRNLNQPGKQNHVCIAWIPGLAGMGVFSMHTRHALHA